MTKETGQEQRQVRDGPDWYEVQVEGQFHPSWFSGLEGWKIVRLPDGSTLLTGPVIDQPALHGLFACIRDMNLKMISLQKIVGSPSVENHDTKKA